MKGEKLYRKLAERGLVSPRELKQAFELYKIYQGTGQNRPFFEILLEKGILPQEKLGQLEIKMGSYHLIRLVGRGNTGAVYQARHVETGEVVALKVLRERRGEEIRNRQRFQREIKISLQLSHPHIVEGKEWGQAEGVTFFAMEYIPGGSLGDLLKREGALSEERALFYLEQVAQALEVIGKKNLIHRDIKPDNIMLAAEDCVKLGDLGLAKGLDEKGKDLTRQGAIVGTPYYISPELIRGEKDIDIRSDIYSLGATFFHLLTGQPVFQGSSSAVVLNQHLLEKVTPYRDWKEKLSRNVYYLLKKMLAKNRRTRPQNPRELLSDIQAVRQGEMPQGYQALPLYGEEERKNSPLSAGLAFLAVVLAVAGVSYFFFFPSSSKEKRLSKKKSPAPKKKDPTSDQTRKNGKDQEKEKGKNTPPKLRHAPPPENLFVDFRRPKFRASPGVKVTANAKVYYHPQFRCLRLVAEGMFLRLNFTLPEEKGLPPSVFLRLRHFTPSLEGKPGYAAIALLVNGRVVVGEFDPYKNHGAHRFFNDWFEVRAFLKSGKNVIQLNFLKKSTVQYWLQYMALEFTPPQYPGFQYLGLATYREGGISNQVRRYRHEKTGLHFVEIPSRTQKKKIHPRFLISQHEVSQGVWKRICGSGTEAEKLWKRKSDAKMESSYPATYITWEEAKRFCHLSGLKLPSQNLWKIAVRGNGVRGKYPWGKAFEGEKLWCIYNTIRGHPPRSYPQKVGTKTPTSFGLFNLAGNVSEWCRDGSYAGAAWSDKNPERWAQKNSFRQGKAGLRSSAIGFRVIWIPGE